MFPQKNLASKPETRRQLEQLRLISFLVPFLLGMRKRMKIPDINQLMVPFSCESLSLYLSLPLSLSLPLLSVCLSPRHYTHGAL